MSAKEMFEKLGYELYIKTPIKFEYRNILDKGDIYISTIKEKHNNDALPKKITCWNDFKCIDFEYGRKGSYLYLKLL